MRVHAAFGTEVSVQRARVTGFDVWIGMWGSRGDDCAVAYLTAAQAKRIRDAIDAVLARLSSTAPRRVVGVPHEIVKRRLLGGGAARGRRAPGGRK
jgi:hypothetical protein